MARKKQEEKPNQDLHNFRAVLEAGRQSEFWQLLKKIIQENVDFLSSKLEGNTDDLEDAKLRLLLKWRNVNKELLVLPDSLIKSLDNAIKGGESDKGWSDLDPYHKNYGEITEDERK